jgi:hypothetical protein
MTTSMRLIALGIAAGAALGCGGGASRTSSTMGSTDGTSTTPVQVVAVELGRSVDAEKKVTERVDVFKPHDTIYASVLINGASPSSTLGVKWTFEDGRVVDQSQQTIHSDGSTATEFHIAKPDGFPSGNYKVEVSVDGGPAKSKDFKITST